MVELTVKDSNNLTSTYSTTLDLTLDAQAPVVEFSVKQVAPRKIFIDLNDSSPVHEDFNGGMVFFGDGNSQELESLFMTYEYAQAGIYEVRVELTNLADQSGEETKSITVTDEEVELSAPIADFFIEELDFADGFRLYFGESGSPNGEIVEYSWSFGDGQTGTGQETIHFYEPGVYDVTLTVTDELGLSGSQTQRIVVHGGAPFIADLNCWSEESFVNCDWSALDSKKSLSQVFFDWGDGQVQEMPIFNSEYELFRQSQYEYQISGEYNIELKVINSFGEQVTESVLVTIQINQDDGDPPILPKPVAILLCIQVQATEVFCDATQSSSENGEITNYSISFSDNDVVDASQASFVYPEYGLKRIGLFISDSAGQGSQAYEEVNLINTISPPTALFDVYLDHDEFIATIDAEASKNNSKVVVEYRLYVGENETPSLVSSSPELVWSFSSLGDYFLTIEVVDSLGRTDRLQKQIRFVEMPVPDPGVQGTWTMEGVDSDEDGIRDDLQRLIAMFEVIDQKKMALDQLAKKAMKLNMTIDNLAAQKAAYIEIQQAIDCYSSFEEDFEVQEERVGVLLAFSFNTKDRFLHYLRSRELMEGEIVRHVMLQENKRAFCEF